MGDIYEKIDMFTVFIVHSKNTICLFTTCDKFLGCFQFLICYE